MLTRAIFSLAALTITSVDALNKELLEHLATREDQDDPTDIFDEEWNDKLYEIYKDIPPEEVFLAPGEFHEGDEDR